ncbi:tryptophan-rich sensory protein [Tenacibaculum sp. S7007]|uniref:Tryptophan-rich sensory protein n=1 Tax=Tenacibaculum pelagium TaxID=2759527 RepID=A0A839ASB8_9FLAO|nr:TspO/MBR family protein [Tenacibaculum pelagium]MBA6157240.1 tryptophan-rich sensory protein [Tenacibaculum pelagium]
MKENKYIRFLLFLVVNFLALAIGVWLMNDGPRTDWYLSLNKAPWTPENWVFGAVWTTIMILFSFYMTKLSFEYDFLDKKLMTLYVVQWFSNISWNYIFFNQYLIEVGLLSITLLWLLIGYFTFEHVKKVKGYTLLIIPYLVWMTIATSLNAYIVMYN